MEALRTLDGVACGRPFPQYEHIYVVGQLSVGTTILRKLKEFDIPSSGHLRCKVHRQQLSANQVVKWVRAADLSAACGWGIPSSHAYN
ncbi:hypothetical protein SCA6_016815 [Theobroma cacao]